MWYNIWKLRDESCVLLQKPNQLLLNKRLDHNFASIEDCHHLDSGLKQLPEAETEAALPANEISGGYISERYFHLAGC